MFLRVMQILLFATAATSIVGQSSVGQLEKDITAIDQAYKDLNSTTNSVSVANMFQTGPLVFKDLEAIIPLYQKDTNDVPTNRLNSADSMKIIKQLQTLQRDANSALQTLIGKYGVFETRKIFVPPIATALRGLEGSEDTFFFRLLNFIAPAQHAALQQIKRSIDQTTTQAISTYSSK